MMNGYILPLGSIVKLNGGVKNLVITGRGQLYNANGTIGYFDYSALRYPEGVQENGGFLYFNHEDIRDVVFEGYRNEQEMEIAESYEEMIKSSNYQKLNVQDIQKTSTDS